jgi:HSP20 family molecular chaperone IbpA
MSRSWYVGEDVKQEDIKAKYDNGILNLTVPKAEPKPELSDDQKYIAIEG